MRHSFCIDRLLCGSTVGHIATAGLLILVNILTTYHCYWQSALYTSGVLPDMKWPTHPMKSRQEAQLPLRNRAPEMYFFVTLSRRKDLQLRLITSEAYVR